MDIVSALKDKNLLGQFLDDISTWRAWITFFKAFFALKPDADDLEIFRKCTGRTQWPVKPARESWLSCGVRGGKSYSIALLATYLAVFREYELSPGERGYILVVAPTKRQSSIIKRYLSSFFHDNAFLRPFVVRETVQELELTSNIVIAVLSSDFRSLRGYTCVCCICDEIAYFFTEGSKTDTEAIRALRTRLASTGGPLICISSPYAKRGTLFETHKRHFGKNKSRILVWQADSLTMNPTLSVDAINQAYQEDGEAAKADYGAQFRSDIETFVTREAVDACIVPSRREIPYIGSVGRYFGFVDPSGGARDAMTLAVAHREPGEAGMLVLDCLRESKPPFSPDSVVRNFAETLKSYRVRHVMGDRYGGEWPRERFQAHGITYQVSPRTRSDIYKELLPLINSGKVELLDSDKLVMQLCGLERRTSRGGRDSVDHGPGGHDDLANAAAGALVMLNQASERFFPNRFMHYTIKESDNGASGTRGLLLLP
jgi:hypothetical protein